MSEANGAGLLLPARMKDPEPRELALSGEVTPAALIALVMQRGGTIEQLAQFVQFKREWEADEAKKAFNAAFANFKSEAVRVIKGTMITDGPLKGKFHANLFDVVVASTQALAKYGLSTSWKLSKDEPQWMEVTCTLRHAAGHSESVAMGAAPDTGPGRNAIQARGSAKTYLERYTLTAILGLAATDSDDDGRGTSTPPAPPPPQLTNEQHAAIQAIKEADSLDACKKAWQAAKKLAKTQKAPHVEGMANAAATERRVALESP